MQVQKALITGFFTGRDAGIKVAVSIEPLEGGLISLRGSINDEELRIQGAPGAPQEATVDGRIATSLREWQTRQRWGRLASSLIHLGTLSAGTPGETHAKWGCTSCLFLGAAVSLSIAAGNFATALAGGATFLENCEGACA